MWYRGANLARSIATRKCWYSGSEPLLPRFCLAGSAMVAATVAISGITPRCARTQAESEPEEDAAVDIYRDSLLRYMGYCNEVGESFRPILPKFVVPSYVLSIGYVFADTQDKARKAYIATGGDVRVVLEHGGDCLVCQLLASVFIPGFTIHQIVHFIDKGCKRSRVLPPMTKVWIPTLTGLVSIPFIVHPIDWGVDLILDTTMRKLYKTPVHADGEH